MNINLYAGITLLTVSLLCMHGRVHAQRADPLTRFTVDGMKTIATTHDGRYIATAGTDSLIRIWDAATGAQVQAFPRKDTVLTVAFLPGDTTLLSVGVKDSAFHVWDWRSGMLLRSKKLHRPLLHAAVTADGEMLAIWVVFPEPQIEFWSIEKGTYQKVAYKGSRKANVAWLDNSSTQLFEWARGGATHLTQFDPPSSRRVPTSSARTYPGGFSPNGRRLIIGREDLTPMVYDAVTLDTLFSLDSANAIDQIYQAIYHPGGEAIITLGQSGVSEPNSHIVIQRWRAIDGAYVDTVAVIDSVFSFPPWMLFSRDGSHLIVYLNRDDGGVVTTWRLRAGTNDVPVVPGIAGVSIDVSPNPASTFTRIRTNVPEPGIVSYSVHDYSGRQVTSWSEDVRQPGAHGIEFHVAGLANGLYFCRMQVGRRVATISFVVHH